MAYLKSQFIVDIVLTFRSGCFVALASCYCLFLSCGERRTADSKESQQSPPSAAKIEKTIEVGDGSVLKRYWSGYDFGNAENINNPEKGEQALVDFINLFPQTSIEDVSLAIKSMFSQAKHSPKAIDFLKKQTEKYLYDPNSPMRNDSYYEPVLEYLLDSARLEPADRLRMEARLIMIRKNKPGTVASDFSYVLADGTKGNLHSFEAQTTLLFFYEPGCSHCEEAIAQLKDLTFFNELISRKQLRVLAVYPFGERSIWKDYQANLPSNWVNAFVDKDDMFINEKYDLKATPTIFLLDDKKRVILKDTDVQHILAYYATIN
ncbi:DUF5106 domain-containing protein [Sphingobacterium sp. LRF_L2]|uniref:DUF5106 domain-containing protein n=1 Tax=Sphingobacterium sp. LRF_L2 TaxID=3369421 RepID=UPI003F5F96A1